MIHRTFLLGLAEWDKCVGVLIGDRVTVFRFYAADVGKICIEAWDLTELVVMSGIVLCDLGMTKVQSERYLGWKK